MREDDLFWMLWSLHSASMTLPLPTTEKKQSAKDINLQFTYCEAEQNIKQSKCHMGV